MTTFTFPSPSLPAVPGFEITAPPDWTSTDVPGAIALISEPPEPGAFRASVTISADRLPPPADLAAASARVLASARETFAKLELVQEKIVTVDGRPAALRFVTFDVEGLEHRVLQMAVLFVVDGEHPHLFQLHGTCLEADAGRYALAFVEIADSFRVTGDG